MTDTRFRIKSVAIEGFKAFTKRQSFDLGARHVFLFGENGLGKTSFVEAIRWCLFGLASRPGGIIKNQFHSGPCIVELTLQAPDGDWSFQRRLRLSGGIGDLTIRDPNGVIRNLEHVFPQLSRIGPRQGTHVIYAAQQPSSRRPEADITDFSYVVFRYLGIEEVPRLIDLLHDLSAEWQVQEDQLLTSIDQLGDSLGGHSADLDKEILQITSAPPWGTTATPTLAVTRNKIDRLAKEAAAMGADIREDALGDLNPGQKLTQTLAAVQVTLSGDIQKLEKKLSDNSLLMTLATSIYEKAKRTDTDHRTHKTNYEQITTELTCILEGTSHDKLKTRLRTIEKQLHKTKANLEVITACIRFIEAIDPESPINTCPACNSVIDFAEFQQYLHQTCNTWDSDTKELVAKRTGLEHKLSTIAKLTLSQNALHTAIVNSRTELDKHLARATEKLHISAPASIDDISDFIQQHIDRQEKLQSAVESQGTSRLEWETRVENLRQELRFHRLRTRSQELQQLHATSYEGLKVEVKELANMRDVVISLKDEIKCQLDLRLDRELPPVAKEMTRAYLRLTERPMFDAIIIHQGENSDGTMSLDLRVSSTRGSGTWSVEDGILNGQALNAIQLVPYFVFSRYQEGPLLDLLLLDDPTQAFDTRKIELLLKELSDATSHATLLVSTHEEDRFLPLLKQHFAEEEIMALRAVDLDEDGPRFDTISITV